jgi:hypothetical protein
MQMETLKSKCEVLGKIAECCCEIKEKVGDSSQKTQDLVRNIDISTLRDKSMDYRVEENWKRHQTEMLGKFEGRWEQKEYARHHSPHYHRDYSPHYHRDRSHSPRYRRGGNRYDNDGVNVNIGVNENRSPTRRGGGGGGGGGGDGPGRS